MVGSTVSHYRIDELIGEGGMGFKIPVDGGPPVRLVDEVSRAPQWSPDGTYIVYGTPLGAAVFGLRAVTRDGQPRAVPEVSVTGFEERYHFMPDGHSLVVLGAAGNYDLWLLDLETGRQRRLTAFQDRTPIESFDISADGKTILFDRVRQNADIYTVDLKHSGR